MGNSTTRLNAALAFTVVLLASVTAVFSFVENVGFAYRDQQAHAAIQTAATVVSLLAASILFGRFRLNPGRTELLLFIALLLLFAANLARAVAPSYDGTNDSVVWVPLAGNILAAAVLAYAAWAPDAPLPRPGRGALPVLASVTAAIAVGAVVGMLSDGWATGLEPRLGPTDEGSPRVIGTPGLLGAQLASLVLFTIAAAGLARRATRTGDELLGWLAVAAVFAAFARLNYFLFPSIYSSYVFVGDMMRLGAYVVILVGALRQISSYQRRAAEAAVTDERRRLARDLHDGLAQDLSFIAMQADMMDEDDGRAQRIAAAARNAIGRSRGAIADLRWSDEPLSVSLAGLATALTRRADVALELALHDDPKVEPQAREELLRLTAEAISNAVRHGGASLIHIELAAAADGTRLRISDDGAGFDSALAENSGGHGLAGMRERAARLAARLDIDSAPGRGAAVTLTLP